MAQLIKIGKKWYSDLRVGGKRIRRALSRDKRFAESKLADLIKEREASRHGRVVGHISWDAFKTRYMAYSATKAPQTHYRDRLSIGKLEKAFPFVKLEACTPERLQAFKDILSQSGNTPGTINREVKAIKAMLNKAMAWGYLPKTDAYRSVKMIREPKGRLIWYTIKELKKLLKHCKGKWKTMAMLGYYAGLRRGEIHTLQNSCLDFTRNRIHIEPSADFTPKDFERRFVPMHPELRAYLKKNQNGSRYVIGDDRPSLGVITSYFRRLVDDAGLNGSLHTLRHTFGAHNAMQGVSMQKLQKWMGHASIKVTQIYSHLSPDHLDKDIERMPKI